MSDTFQEKLVELRKKASSSLTESDREFLWARRSYLHEHELVSLGLSAPTPQPESEPEDQIVPEDEPVKQAKKPKAKVKTQEA
jgi:hypothetical protein